MDETSESGVSETSDTAEGESVSVQGAEISTDETDIGEISPNDGGNEFGLFGFGAGETENVEYEQTLAETAHTETKDHMIESYGIYMSEVQQEMLKSEETKNQLTVMSREDYETQFSDFPLGVLGHCDPEGNIYIKGGSETAISHISTHETMHLCANRETNTDDIGTTKTTSGFHDVEVTPSGYVISDLNRGINEGFTELYTMRELESRGEQEAAYAVSAYLESQEWAQRLEEVVGKEKVAEAYFGNGRESLEQEFAKLNQNDPGAWGRFSKNVDIVEYSDDVEAVLQAKSELTQQYIEMVMNRDIMREEGEN